MTARDQSGSTAVELAVLAPVLVLVLLLVVCVGRLVLARQQVQDAATDAARAASIATTPVGAQAAADTAAQSDLAAQHITCDPYRASVDTADFTAGGAVSVTVRCTASLSGLALLRLPGAETLSSTVTAPLDRYRATPGASG